MVIPYTSMARLMYKKVFLSITNLQFPLILKRGCNSIYNARCPIPYSLFFMPNYSISALTLLRNFLHIPVSLRQSRLRDFLAGQE